MNMTPHHTPAPWALTVGRFEAAVYSNGTIALLDATTTGWEANARLICAAPDLLSAARCALADLEGIMPEFDPSGDREHPAWRTIEDLRKAIDLAAPRPPLKWWLVNVTVRHGDMVAKRNHLIRANTDDQAYLLALEAEASCVGTEMCDLEVADGGHYSKYWDFHYKRGHITELEDEVGETLRKYL
jgi:hypothetical protein